MERQRFRLKPKATKKRKTWLIKPQSKVHSEEGYKRKKEKKKLEQLLEESLKNEEEFGARDKKRRQR
jgi:hypothetical protein